MRIAIIGLGRAGQVHLAAAREVTGVEVVAACDPASSGQDAAEAAGLRAYARLEDLLALEDIDAAVISTPPSDHAAAAIACLTRGIHVLCEKPLALRSSDISRMFAVNHGTRLAVASKFRHVVELQRARDLLRNGDLGEPAGFHISFRARVDMSERWNSRLERSGGGVVADNGGHVFDIVSFLFGALARVRAVEQAPLQPLPVEDSATIEIETASGITGTAELSWSLPPAGDAYVTIQGSQATAIVGWKSSVLERKQCGSQPLGAAYDRGQAHRSMHAAFRAAVCDGRPLWIEPRECLQSVAAIEACYRSLRSGCSEAVMATPSDLGHAGAEAAVSS